MNDKQIELNVFSISFIYMYIVSLLTSIYSIIYVYYIEK